MTCSSTSMRTPTPSATRAAPPQTVPTATWACPCTPEPTPQPPSSQSPQYPPHQCHQPPHSDCAADLGSPHRTVGAPPAPAPAARIHPPRWMELRPSGPRGSVDSEVSREPSAEFSAVQAQLGRKLSLDEGASSPEGPSSPGPKSLASGAMLLEPGAQTAACD